MFLAMVNSASIGINYTAHESYLSTVLSCVESLQLNCTPSLNLRKLPEYVYVAKTEKADNWVYN